MAAAGSFAFAQSFTDAAFKLIEVDEPLLQVRSIAARGSSRGGAQSGSLVLSPNLNANPAEPSPACARRSC